MSAIGSGQFIRIVMWCGEEIVQDGVLLPGEEISLRFSDGPQLVEGFSLERLTRDDYEQMCAEKPAVKHVA